MTDQPAEDEAYRTALIIYPNLARLWRLRRPDAAIKELAQAFRALIQDKVEAKAKLARVAACLEEANAAYLDLKAELDILIRKHG